MHSSSISSLFREDPRTAEILRLLSDPDVAKARIRLKGLIGSARSLVSAAAFEASPGLHCFILPDKESAAYFFNDLEQIFSEKDLNTEKRKVLFFPSSFKQHSSGNQKDNMGLLSRSEVLNRLHSRAKKFIMVTYPEAVTEKVVNRKYLEKNTLKLTSGEPVSLEFLLDLLVEYEFERVDFVIEPGQFSLRGGLIDVYSFSGEHPYRIEFDGDRVASIRTFDATTQLSIEKKTEITILPDIRVNRERRIRFDAIFEFFPERSVIWADDLASLASAEANPDDPDFFLPGEEVIRNMDKFPVIEFGKQAWYQGSHSIEYLQSPQPVFHKNFDLLFEHLQENSEKGIRNILLAANEKQSERLESILADLQAKNHSARPLSYTLVKYPLHEGFVERTLNLAFYTDHQIFERYHRFHLRDGYASREALTLKELYDLKPGDYVTHIDHGVGKFDGLEKIVNHGREQEAIRLIYKNNDILYVSIHSLHRISKYIGKDGNPPVLNRLGSDAWTKLKNKTKSRVRDIAKDLIRLYAERRATHGFACTPDTYLQTELEASFMYEDTPDQLKATTDVKKDLEAGYPMDRLICGDVGFGKTEIAIRAAFKMVTESKQVAILVPTTILALQHYKTFSDRLRDFPCTVGYINRFKSAKAQKKILAELEAGTLDILIGTHRILGKDVKFKDLGLLIIDEEQKFGVAAKEKIRHLRINVDTLTLTATPIPRTLQFSLMGARDLSIINTPPPNRYPIQTEIHTFREEIIRDAIRYEVSRGGQVFFVNSRVQNILEVAGMIQRAVPEVKIGIAHGQMEGRKLENVMVDFIEGDLDVLVATTIIESGLDIPNVNTIIINDAQQYGLSDLHQLRGRVGRSNKKAFCYLLAPSLTSLTGEAKKRLQAIEEFSELGSGFNIAMRDLDIRGAGNILGAEQSGFISEIGFDMYQKILDEAILELKEQEFRELFNEEHPAGYVRDCTIETDLEILIPDHYITNITERLSLYKELDSLEKEDELDAYRARITDRFGPLPEQTESLIETIRLRWLAKSLNFEKLVLRNDRLMAYLPGGPESPYYQSEEFSRLLAFLRDHPDYCRMKEDKNRLFLVFRNVRTVADALQALVPLQPI
ncbi:MAG TPA: transcription-repair coupling factor [Bacteroidales bacterium]|nr:transcription-repair coupling factor [Bacteroidales bacterium]